MDQDVYTQYFLGQDQLGDGLSDIGSVYKRRKYPQSGRGIGSIFSGIMKSLKPILKSTAKVVGKQSFKTGKAVLKNLGKQTLKENLRNHGKLMLAALAQKGSDQIEKFNSMKNIDDINQMEVSELKHQLGNGTSLSFGFGNKKGFKRKSKLNSSQFTKRSKRVNKKVVKKIKKKASKKSKSKKQKHRDIFS